MEQTYGKEVAQVITQRFLNEYLEYREDGVYIRDGYVENDPIGLFTWTPACELEGPEAPDALTAPALPIPFTARELGAFLLNGVGAHIVGCYGGSYECGPDKGMLNDLGIRAGKAREALHAAYVAILDAQNTVGALDEAKQNRAAELKNKYADEYDTAFERENVMERVIIGKHKNGNPEYGDFIPNDEYLLRFKRAKEAVSTLELQALQAKTEADTERNAWLKCMVRQLLQHQTAPATDTATPAPVVQAKAKRRTWWDVSSPYIVEIMQAGQYATAKELYSALEAKAGSNSPFDIGTGNNRFSLFIRELAMPLARKTVQNNWQKLLEAAKKK